MNTLKVTRDQGVITDKKPRACARTKHRYFVPSYMLDATDKNCTFKLREVERVVFFGVVSGRGRPPRASHLHWTRMQYLNFVFYEGTVSFFRRSIKFQGFETRFL